jgi:hypothetical protein
MRWLLGLNAVVLVLVLVSLLQTIAISGRVDRLVRSTGTDSGTTGSLQDLSDEIDALRGKPASGILGSTVGLPSLSDLRDEIGSIQDDLSRQLDNLASRLSTIDDELSNLEDRISGVENEVSNVCAALSGC